MLALRSADAGLEWVVTLGPDRIDVQRQDDGLVEESALIVTGTASDLELTLYDRPTLSPIDITATPPSSTSGTASSPSEPTSGPRASAGSRRRWTLGRGRSVVNGAGRRSPRVTNLVAILREASSIISSPNITAPDRSSSVALR